MCIRKVCSNVLWDCFLRMDSLKWLPISHNHKSHVFFLGFPPASTITAWLPSVGWWGWSPQKLWQFQVFFQGWPEHRDHNALISTILFCVFLGCHWRWRFNCFNPTDFGFVKASLRRWALLNGWLLMWRDWRSDGGNTLLGCKLVEK